MTVRFGVAAVYQGVTTTMAIAESTDLAYERAFEEHWTDVFRFALAWTNDWTVGRGPRPGGLSSGSGTTAAGSTGAARSCPGCSSRPAASPRTGSASCAGGSLAPTHAASIDTDPALRARWLDVCAAMRDLSSLERTALVMTAVQGAT